jgi:hypothetical protein
LNEEFMSKKAAFATALLAALVVAVASLPVGAQTPAQTKEEKKAATAEQKAKKKSDRTAAKLRQKECGVAWKDKRAAGKIEKGETWPKFYSACNKRLKEKAA